MVAISASDSTLSVKRLKQDALSTMARIRDPHLERLCGILREIPVSGDRNPAAAMAFIDA